MANEEFTDDYVAKLLAKDAKESSIRFSAMGLQGFESSKPPANKPKPNTRFLRNIIKETDNHNTALLAKEAAEARARLRTLPSHQEKVRKPVRVGEGDIRKRQLGDIIAITSGRSSNRRRTEDKKRDGSRYVNTSGEKDKPQEKSRENRRDRESRKHTDDGRSSRDHRSRHRRDRSISEDRDVDRKERRHRHRSRSRSPREHRDRDSKRRERSRQRNRSISPDGRRKTERPSRYTGKTPEEDQSNPERKPEPKPDYDSDPLDDIIGPRSPEIKIRGRGAASYASGIDARFSANYDPTTDVALDTDEEDDWGLALEALKDRQRWKQQGADRLRAAGFTEDEIKKWESGGQKQESDVKWAKQGEGREWDRGKVFDEEGVVKAESSYGRLTSLYGGKAPM